MQKPQAINYLKEKIGLSTVELVQLFDRLNVYPRCYHDENHIIDLVTKIRRAGHSPDMERKLLIVALFHDIVYDPKSKCNEEDSAEELGQSKKFLDLNDEDFKECYNAIIDTKTHSNFTSKLSRVFCELDLSGFAENAPELIRQEMRIRKEYAHVDWEDYRKGKIEFLTKYLNGPIPAENTYIKMGMRWMLEHITNEPNPNIAVYAGSFNPFHIGHQNILEKAEKLFDKVVIAYLSNPEKGFNQPIDNCEYLKYHQVDNARRQSLVAYLDSKSYNPTLIRGLRNTTDLQQEMNFLRALQDMKPFLKVVYLISDSRYEHVSSSLIRSVSGYEDLKQFSQQYLPKIKK